MFELPLLFIINETRLERVRFIPESSISRINVSNLLLLFTFARNFWYLRSYLKMIVRILGSFNSLAIWSLDLPSLYKQEQLNVF